jgi:hypothetical protein
MCTTCSNIKTPSVRPHCLFRCSECFSQHTVTVHSHSYHRLVFIMHTDRVHCEVATQFHTLFTDTCRPGISPGPVRAHIRWGTGFPISTISGSTPPVPDTDLYLNTNAIRRSSLQTFTQSNALADIWGSTGIQLHAAQVRTCQSERCVAYSLEAFLFTVCSHTHRMMADWLTARDWEGSGRGIIYGTLLKCL